nr:hypothetical protein [Tanacetum cinerariifolium]
MTNRIKPEPITDVKIHRNTKPIVASVFRNNDKRNFNVHNPFKFIDFGITELDELGPIIQKKKNFIVKDLMISLSKRYERLKKVHEELRIQFAILALVPKQVSSQTTGRKMKHIELEPEIKVPGLECNRSLPEGVPFVNNMVIEEPKYEIFFTNVFGTTRINFQDLSAEPSQTPRKQDFDNWFGPIYEEYFKKITPKGSTNSVVLDTIHNDDTPPSTIIIVAEDEVPHIVSTTTDETPS